jgi:hypothetical protein
MMPDESWRIVLESTYEAVRAYARVEFAALTRKIIYRMRRCKASGIFGDDYAYKTLWDEYSHEVREGPHELLQCVWQDTIRVFIDDVIEQVPRHAAVLLSVFAASELDCHDEARIVGSVWRDGLRNVLRASLASEAGSRRLDHFLSA